MPPSVPLTFLGTGNALAQGRYFNSFLIGGRVLVEPSPVVLPNLRRIGADLAAIDTVFISHFHADHTFGWPFLLLEYLIQTRRRSDLWVVGPRGVQAQLEDMVRVGFYPQHSRERGGFDLHCIEVKQDGSPQEAGGVWFRAERVEHVPELECYGFLIEHEGRSIGYSGDTRLCDGLRRIAAGADTLVLECNQRHGPTLVHMTLNDVRTLRHELPDTPFVLTHLGDDVDTDGIPGVRLAQDLETVDG
ncbi:MAG: ribonuclease Z [Chloroflexi bacterium]|nr:ribonuclease Z [Chloroflexota bacterium]